MRTKLILAVAVVAVGLLLLAARPTRSVDASTALRLGVPELVERAGLVLEAEVASARSVEGPGGLIETEYVLEVDRNFWGGESAERTVRMPGGVLEDGRGLVLPGLPRLAPGQDVLLFLSEPGSSGVRVPVGLSQGVFRVVTDAEGRRWVVRDPSQLTVANLVTGSLTEGGTYSRRDYAAVVAEIHAAVEHRLAGELSSGEAR